MRVLQIHFPTFIIKIWNFKLHSRAAPSVRGSHHCSVGPTKGRNPGGRQKKKKKKHNQHKKFDVMHVKLWKHCPIWENNIQTNIVISESVYFSQRTFIYPQSCLQLNYALGLSAKSRPPNCKTPLCQNIMMKYD